MIDLDIFALNIQILQGALFIFALRIVDVAMGTVRVILITRGFRKWATVIGFIEITIWIVAISQTLAELDNIWNVFGYSGGFAMGTLVGMWIENRLALGNADIHIISLEKGVEIAEAIRKAGYGATQLQAIGQSGPVAQIDIVIPRKEINAVIRLVNGVDPTSFITIADAQTVIRGYKRLAKKL